MSDKKFAFQCNNCGAIEPAEAAGDNDVPGACHVCRRGVRYEVHKDGTGFTVVREPENWIKLADLSEEELAADFERHGLTKADVVAHVPKNEGKPPQGTAINRKAEETVASRDTAR